jgi:hypothetical protein
LFVEAAVPPESKMVRKILEIKVVDRRKDGGRITISTGSPDRDRDRVFPRGARLDDYLKNPIVQWGHNYFDPWATVGRSSSIEIGDDGVIADFDLRPAANEADPQNIVLLLWDGEWVRTASIGFIPLKAEPNEFGGLDFLEWELLEWSLVPVPANQDALRLAAKSFPDAYTAYTKRGRVLSATNEKKIKEARDNLDEVLAQLADEESSDDGKAASRRRQKAEAIDTGSSMAWVRRMEAVSDLGVQQLYAVFRQYRIDIPKDETTLRCDDNGDIVEVPHPDAGKSVTRKEVVFVPPIAYIDDEWGDDATYSISASAREDADMVKGMGGNWEVTYLGEVLDQIPQAKSARRRPLVTMGIQVLTQRALERAKAIIRRAPREAPVPDDEADAAQLLARLNDIHARTARR